MKKCTMTASFVSLLCGLGSAACGSPIELPIEDRLVVKLDVSYGEGEVRATTVGLEPGVAGRSDAGPKELGIRLLDGNSRELDTVWFKNPLDVRVYPSEQLPGLHRSRRGTNDGNVTRRRASDVASDAAPNNHTNISIPSVQETYYVPFNRRLVAVELVTPNSRNTTRVSVEKEVRAGCREMRGNPECVAWLKANATLPQ